MKQIQKITFIERYQYYRTRGFHHVDAFNIAAEDERIDRGWVVDQYRTITKSNMKGK